MQIDTQFTSPVKTEHPKLHVVPLYINNGSFVICVYRQKADHVRNKFFFTVVQLVCVDSVEHIISGSCLSKIALFNYDHLS